MSEASETPVVEAADPAADPASEVPAGPERPSLTEREASLLGALVRYAVQEDNAISRTFAVMLFCRQLYAVARKDLDLKLAELPDKRLEELFTKALEREELTLEEGDSPEEIYTFLSSALEESCREIAARPFSEMVLFPAFENIIAPWFQETVEKHRQAYEQAQREAWDEFEKERRTKPVHLGLPVITSTAEDPVTANPPGDITREQPLILVGWAPAIRYLLNRITSQALAFADGGVYQVVRLFDKVKPFEKATDAPARLAYLGSRDWEDLTKSRHTPSKVFLAKVVPQLQQAIDLVIVDDLVKAGASQGLQLGHSDHAAETKARKATQANKVLRGFVSGQGAGGVFAIPMTTADTTSYKAGTLIWQELAKFSTLRFVSCEAADELNYRVAIGSAEPLVVPKDEIDQCRASNIILPT